MKKSILAIFSLVILTSLNSCKKTTVAPAPTNTNTVDTVYINHTDTVYTSPMSIIGVWKAYKTETIQNGQSTFSNENYVYSFTSTQVLMDLDQNGSYELSYNAVYGSGYVDIYYTSVPKTNAISIVGNEYRLNTTDTGGNTFIIYLKK